MPKKLAGKEALRIINNSRQPWVEGRVSGGAAETPDRKVKIAILEFDLVDSQHTYYKC